MEAYVGNLPAEEEESEEADDNEREDEPADPVIPRISIATSLAGITVICTSGHGVLDRCGDDS